MLITQAREAVANNVSEQEAKDLTGELLQMAQSLAAARATSQNEDSASVDEDEDDVVDAEFDK